MMKGRQTIIAILLLGCVGLIASWEIMAARSRQPFRPFSLTSEDFKGFIPQSGLWQFTEIPPVVYDKSAPNILSYLATRADGNQVVVRLVHGYNMPMCMKIKGYHVEILADHSPSRGDQIWRLTSETGDAELWVTAILRTADLARTDVDIRDMAFPRISSRDDPRWVPRGLTRDSLRHPIESLRTMLRARWNNARCDIATFLKWRQPAWADPETLAVVAYSRPASGRQDQEESVIRSIAEARDDFLRSLIQWNRENRSLPAPTRRSGA